MTKKIDDILQGPMVPDPPEPKPLKMGDPHPPPGVLEKLREFIPCRRGLTWEWLQEVARSFEGEHALSVNRVWTHPTAPARFTYRERPELWIGGPFFVDSSLVLGKGSLEFCKAVKRLLDAGDLQVLPGGVMQHAVEPSTGYAYQFEPPKLPGLHVTITPGD